MRKLVSIVMLIVWALWFGGLITLFMSVQTVFKHDRDVAKLAAPMMFHAFEVYQLVLAGAALVVCAAWPGQSRVMKAVLIVLLGLATTGAVIGHFGITPQIDALVAKGQSASDEFKRLHGISMMVFVSEATLLLTVGILLGWAIPRAERS